MLSPKLSHAWLGTVATNAAILACLLMSGILLARLLGPDGRGSLAAVMFWPQLIIGVGLLSLNDGIIYHAHKRRTKEGVFVTTAISLSLLLATLAMTVGFVLLPHLLGPEHAHLAPMAQAYLLGIAPFTFVDVACLAWDQSAFRFRRSNLVRLVLSHTYLLGLLLLWVFGAVSIATALWANWLGVLLTAIARIALIRRDLTPVFSVSDAKAILAASQRFHPAFLVYLLGSQADRMVVITFWDASSIGHYVVAASLATAGLGVLTHSFDVVLYPKVASGVDDEEKKRWLLRGLRFSNLIIGLSSLGLAAAVSWLVPFLYGDTFTPAVVPATILALAGWPLALRLIIVRCLRAFDRSRLGATAELLALAGFAILVGPLSDALNLVGVALALAIANVGAVMYLAFAMARILRVTDWHGFDVDTLGALWLAVRANVPGAYAHSANSRTQSRLSSRLHSRSMHRLTHSHTPTPPAK